MRAVSVRASGWMSSIQDLGRPGSGHLGVPPSGVIDIALASTMNRIVGNPDHLAVMETAGDLIIEAHCDLLVASSDSGAVRTLRRGDQHRVHPMGERNFGYLAIRGGINASQVLGSASQDHLSGIGPGVLTTGTIWEIGPEPSTPILVDQVAIGPLERVVRIWPGPHLGLFAPDTYAILLENQWTTTGSIDRIGVRVDGPQLPRESEISITSEPMLTGAIQIPPDGQLIVMLRDHPTTGGYPVVAVVDPEDLHLIAQTPPGRSVRFIDGSQDQRIHPSPDTVPHRRR
jgi:biotin-dependent carboxylase-like uncharacterized protein